MQTSVRVEMRKLETTNNNFWMCQRHIIVQLKPNRSWK